MPGFAAPLIPSVYQLRVVLREVSPLIWRRLLVRADTTIADLHATLQIAFGWDDAHLHRFLIHGSEYGIAYSGGISFRDDPRSVNLAHFSLRVGERFVYDYDLIDGWRHDVRLERVVSLEPERSYPVCTGGRRARPPEGCGGAWAFVEQRQRHTIFSVTARLAELLEDLTELEDHRAELLDLRRWLSLDRFDRRAVNKALAQQTVAYRSVA
ncbi:MAG: plasmid pRiA4b ORF-3 family protein [Candidatus Dormibacteria bacterium]